VKSSAAGDGFVGYPCPGTNWLTKTLQKATRAWARLSSVLQKNERSSWKEAGKVLPRKKVRAGPRQSEFHYETVVRMSRSEFGESLFDPGPGLSLDQVKDFGQGPGKVRGLCIQ
jgi:hypothetical protein